VGTGDAEMRTPRSVRVDIIGILKCIVSLCLSGECCSLEGKILFICGRIKSRLQGARHFWFYYNLIVLLHDSDIC
jgi:hypothetical protein